LPPTCDSLRWRKDAERVTRFAIQIDDPPDEILPYFDEGKGAIRPGHSTTVEQIRNFNSKETRTYAEKTDADPATAFRLALTQTQVAGSLAFAQLQHFTAQAVVDQELNYTAVGGRFSPTGRIDLTSKVVTLAVVGNNSFDWTFPAGSFKKTWLGGYVASVRSGSTRIDVLLQPLNRGDWTYSVGIQGLVLGSTSMRVSLTIGSQLGSITVNAYAF